MGAYLMSIMVTVCVVAGWVAVTWINARYSRPRETEADLSLEELQQRVSVLERIVTDRRRQLSQEIERLRQ